MARQKRVEKKPNFIYQFDGKEYSKEEQEYLIFRFVQVLNGIDKRMRGKDYLCA